jgi:hypothetical protein
MEAFIVVFKTLSPEQQEQVLRTFPGRPPPNGIEADFINPPTQNVIGVIVVTICTLLVLVMGSLRLFTRIFIIKKWRLEDCMFLQFCVLQFKVNTVIALGCNHTQT